MRVSKRLINYYDRRSRRPFDVFDSLTNSIRSKNVVNGREQPGLVVMGGDTCPEGCGFKSQHCILEGPFSHIFVVKMVLFVGKDENK